ncbi:hypothetical protein P4H71_15200 [Paenibacillus kribbensis]|uniref:hypothetical protein n=1 Tax=Paenibacillus kribbensis TaxID=172713 RepID=UPI002DBBB95D|nr:hypothetical protein [Paenibacillus kribbensis]MEC0235676.1 hypothetical protein [Paenibacillus kribbensis]
MVINQQLKRQENEQVIPKSTLQNVRDLIYQGKGSIIPQFRKHFEWDSLMATRFTDTHEGAPYVLDLIAFKDQEEKRYLIEMHLGSKEVSVDLDEKISDKNLYLVIGIQGTYNSSKLTFFTWVDRLESPILVESVYDRHLLAEPLFLHTEKRSLQFQRCVRR